MRPAARSLTRSSGVTSRGEDTYLVEVGDRSLIIDENWSLVDVISPQSIRLVHLPLKENVDDRSSARNSLGAQRVLRAGIRIELFGESVGIDTAAC